MRTEIKIQQIQERIKDAAEKRAEKFNAEHRLLNFNVRQKVLLKAQNVGHASEITAKEFFRLFNGPFMLSEKVRKNTYIVVNTANERIISRIRVKKVS